MQWSSSGVLLQNALKDTESYFMMIISLSIRNIQQIIDSLI